VIMLGGPPLYLGGFQVETVQLEQGLRNLERLVEAVPLVILEHHALRDETWRTKLERVFQKATQSGHCVLTAAEFTGKENQFLESKRKELYHDHPPSSEFKQWTKTLNNRKITKPPL
jgi:predicted metallo-beta-lactamase superfamily hydrolase